MPSYTLQWEIEWDADTPKKAAQEVVREFFAGVGNADHFTVVDQETGEIVEVDAFSDDDSPIICDACGLDKEDFYVSEVNTVCCEVENA